MLPKKQRLKKRKDFQQVFNSRKVLSSDHFRLHFDFQAAKPMATAITSRCAVVTSKKLGKAHVRNKLRRQVFEIYAISPIRQSPNISLVIINKKGIEGLNFREMSSELSELLARIKY